MHKKKLEEFVSFVRSFDSSDRIAILHDSDADGISAAVICARAVERLRGSPPDLVITQKKRMVSIEKETVRKLKQNRINKFITLDLAVDQEPQKFRPIEKFAQVLVIDHHKVYSNLSSKKTVFIKASELSPKVEPSKYATSKLVFDLFSRVTDLSDLDWVACVGMVGDFSVNAWKSFVNHVLKTKKLSMHQIKGCTEIVNAVEIIHVDDISSLFQLFYKASHPKDLLESRFSSYREKVEEERSRLLKEFDKKSEAHPKQELIFFQFKSKYSIKSAVVDYLSTKIFPNKTLVVVEDIGNGILTISARRQDYKVKMNDLLEKAVKPLTGGIAGGHVPAAGGKIRRADLAQFKANVLKILGHKE